MIHNLELPVLSLADWRESRNTLHQYAKLAGQLRAAFMPRQKHWGHITLHAAASGLTTTPMPVDGKTLELLLDCTSHRFAMSTSHGEKCELPLEKQSIASVRGGVLEALRGMGIEPEFDGSTFSDQALAAYDGRSVERYWRAVAWIDSVFKCFKGELRGNTGPVHVFPHHFDLSVNWFSGRLVPGVDPADEESSEEQMNFGFLSGDDAIPEAYFYVTAYPTPKDLTDAPLPDGAYWHHEGFTGAIMPYDTIRAAGNPELMLLNYLRTVQQAGAQRM